MRNRFVLLLLIPTINVFAGTPIADGSLKGWETSVVERANSAENVKYMTDDEKKVIFYINLCRMQPKLFMKTILKQYLDDNPSMASNSYTLSLIEDLKNGKAMDPLQPDAGLYNNAEKWAVQSGKLGETGHGNFDKRFAGFLEKYDGAVGENCDYGYSDPLSIVMDLLIDDGVEGIGHRTNILAACFTTVGVSIKPHKGYAWDCVMDFGGTNSN